VKLKVRTIMVFRRRHRRSGFLTPPFPRLRTENS
jgi:hypothetical protein